MLDDMQLAYEEIISGNQYITENLRRDIRPLYCDDIKY